MSNDILTARQLATRLGPSVSVSSLYRMASNKIIPSIPWGAKQGGRRFVESEVRAALAAKEKALRPYYRAKVRAKGQDAA